MTEVSKEQTRNQLIENFRRDEETISVVAYACVVAAEEYGITDAEFGELIGKHHGKTSGALSHLHKKRRVVRLTEKRDVFTVYVLPEHMRERDSHGHPQWKKQEDAT